MKTFVYHGTDYPAALNIIEEGFKIKYNSKHWLGNGVYFFFDEALARWWTTNPTEKHGVKINNPALIKAQLSINKDKVIDLRNLHDFYKLIHLEKEFRSGAKQLIGDDIILQQQYRCAFFDYIFQRYDIEIIIGTFHKMEQSYIDKSMLDFLGRMDLTYTEVQICINESVQKRVLSELEII